MRKRRAAQMCGTLLDRKYFFYVSLDYNQKRNDKLGFDSIFIQCSLDPISRVQFQILQGIVDVSRRDMYHQTQPKHLSALPNTV